MPGLFGRRVHNIIKPFGQRFILPQQRLMLRNSLDDGGQFLGIDRFLQIIVNAGAQRRYRRLRIHVPGEKNDVSPPAVRQFFNGHGQFGSRHAWHPDV